MPILELILMIIVLGAAAYLGWSLMQPWFELQQDRRHIRRLTRRRSSEEEDRPEAERSVETPWMEHRLRAAGLEFPAIVGSIAVAFVVAFAFFVTILLFPRSWWIAPIVAIVVLWAMYALVEEYSRYRAWRFENGLVDTIDLMVGALSAGENPVDAMASAAYGSQEPVRSEFRELVTRIQAALPIERAVARMVARYDSEGVRLFTQLLIVKWDVGGPLAPTLKAVNRTIREGIKLRRQLFATMSTAQMTAVAVAAMPYLLIPFFLWQRPQALQKLWAHPLGPQLVLWAIVIQIIGFIWLRRILRTEL